MPVNYKDMVAQLMGLVQPVGDVIPFRRQSIEPGMGLTEGAGRMGGNKGGAPDIAARYSQLGKELDELYAKGVPPHNVEVKNRIIERGILAEKLGNGIRIPSNDYLY